MTRRVARLCVGVEAGGRRLLLRPRRQSETCGASNAENSADTLISDKSVVFSRTLSGPPLPLRAASDTFRGMDSVLLTNEALKLPAWEQAHIIDTA